MAPVGVALREDPPLPGDGAAGWSGLGGSDAGTSMDHGMGGMDMGAPPQWTGVTMVIDQTRRTLAALVCVGALGCTSTSVRSDTRTVADVTRLPVAAVADADVDPELPQEARALLVGWTLLHAHAVRTRRRGERRVEVEVEGRIFGQGVVGHVDDVHLVIALEVDLVEAAFGKCGRSETRFPRDRHKRDDSRRTGCGGGRDATDAETRYRVVARTERATLLAMGPITGRTHQLRVHASHAGAPLPGDRNYAARRDGR